MAQDINPYQSPEFAPADVSPAVCRRPWLLRPFWVFVFGAVIGCVSFIASFALIPTDLSTPGPIQPLLIERFTLIFFPLTGVWFGVVRGSRKWTAGGVVIGLMIGAAIYAIWEILEISRYRYDLRAVASPCLTGSGMSVTLGAGGHSWRNGIIARAVKGIIAAYVLGFVYAGLQLTAMNWFPLNTMEQFYRMMWCSGPAAASTAGGLYLLVLAWASNLRSIVASGPHPSPDISKVAERDSG